MNEDHWPLIDIAAMLDPPVHPKWLQNLGSPNRRRRNGFPDPVKKTGRFEFFSLTEVQEWWFYYRRATTRWKKGDHLA